jgi:hypothetical protein
MSNKGIYTGITVPKIREEITKFSVKYRDKIQHTQKNLHPDYLKKKKKSLED